ncbi:hypothetical protein IGI95_002649 [Enterococcus sp. DIV0784]|uniref:YhgE/Pip family protein n=1 Tax=unclassified Enterococcus TaxID=2608891 RepID=UPI003F22B3B1
MLIAEWKAIIRNKFFWGILVALALVPAIYNFIFLGSMWDPYGNLNKLPVAVVNLDKEYKSNNLSFRIGKDVITEMKKSKDLDYHFMDKTLADKGLRDGKYYMVITFPKDFSKNAASLIENNPKSAEVDYKTTRGHNYISAKMSEGAIKELKSKISENITKTYTKKIFNNIDNMKKGITQIANGSDKLASGSSSLKKGTDTLANNLEILASSSLTFKDGSDKLDIGLKQYVSGVNQVSNGTKKLSGGVNNAADGSKKLNNGINQLADGGQKLTKGIGSASDGSQKLSDGVSNAANGGKQLYDGVTQFSNGTSRLSTGTQELADKSKDISTGIEKISDSSKVITQFKNATNQLIGGLSEMKEKTNISESDKQNIKQLSAGLNELNQKLQEEVSDPSISNKIENDLKDTQSILTNLVPKQLTAIQQTDAYKILMKEHPELVGQLENAISNQTAVPDLVTVEMDLKDVSTQLNLLNQQSQKLAQTSRQLLPPSSGIITRLSEGTYEINDTLNQRILPGMNQLNSGLSDFQNQFNIGAKNLTDGFNKFSTGIDKVNSGASDISKKSQELQVGSQKLSNGLDKLHTGSQNLTNGLTNLQKGSVQAKTGIYKLQNGSLALSSGLEKLKDGGTSLVSGISKLQANNAPLSSGSDKLSDGANKLSSGTQKLSNGADSLSKGAEDLNTGTGKLSSSLEKADHKLAKNSLNDKNAKRIASPIKTRHTDKDNAPVNGFGMTPYMICVALFIGALASNVVIGIGFSNSERTSGKDFMLSKIGINGVIAVAQAFIVYGAVYVLGLRANYGIRMLLSVVLISCAFMAINTFFLSWLGKVGEFIMIVILVLQLSTSAGTYPIQLSPGIYQMISPWLPMTYSIRMLRETIGLQGHIGMYVVIFALLSVVFTVLLSVFKKIPKFG